MIKNIILVAGIILLVLIIWFVTRMILSSRPMSKEKAVIQLKDYFEKKAKSAKDYSGVQVSIYSESLGVDWQFAKGTSVRAGTLTIDQPFHIASVGKLFTGSIIYQLAEAGKIGLDDPITTVFAAETLENLFVYEGVNYRDQVTFRQLLSHTSGIADYFGGPVTSGELMSKRMGSDPDHVWKPQELLDFSKDFQVPVNAPGKGYSYSDSGYVLLGLIIEVVEGKPFETVLAERIFQPLGMQNSYMAMRAEPLSGNRTPIADLWLEGTELGDKQVLSVDWAGGGVISTVEDLMRFSKALHSEQLINRASLEAMFSNTHVFEQGIFTGDGGMTVRFKEFFPLLNLPLIRGHIGILSTHVFYDPTTDTHIVMNFGSTSKMQPSFVALIEILNTLKRIKN